MEESCSGGKGRGRPRGRGRGRGRSYKPRNKSEVGTKSTSENAMSSKAESQDKMKTEINASESKSVSKHDHKDEPSNGSKKNSKETKKKRPGPKPKRIDSETKSTTTQSSTTKKKSTKSKKQQTNSTKQPNLHKDPLKKNDEIEEKLSDNYENPKVSKSSSAKSKPSPRTVPNVPEALGKFKPSSSTKVPTILCVAEKPSLARSISAILSKGDYSTSTNGPTPIHTFTGKFNGYESYFKFTAVTGHIYSCDFPSKYNNWNAIEPQELFEVETEKVLSSKSSGRICKHLQEHAKGCDVLMLWLDCDREGENICFEVIENTEKWMNSHPYICRARFSSLSPVDILKAMDKLVLPNLNESLSVDARQILDLKVGVAFTRYQSTLFHERFANLNSRLISYGPCQTPTLYFCVQRHDEIQTFVPKKFWKLSVELEILSGRRFENSQGRFFKKNVANEIKNALLDVGVARVVSFTEKSKKIPRPLPLNTVGLLKIASSGMGMGPHHTMKLAESLYLSGYISYPRTETTKYSPAFDIETVLRHHTNHPDWGEYIRRMESARMNNGGVDVGDHPPITPVRPATSAELSGDEWRLYEYITRHFIASVSTSASSITSKIDIQIGTEIFSLSSSRLERRGFLDVMPWLSPRDEPPFPLEFKQTESLIPIHDIMLSEGLTSPPDYLTESELISLMEKHGIGTDASIATHINNICERNYVHIGNNRKLIPNELGIVLIHGYLKIDPELALPNLRSRIEEMVNSICKGQESFENVVEYGINTFAEKFSHFTRNIEMMSVLFESHFSTIEETMGKLLSKCGTCRRNMKYIALKPSRLFCMTCDETYSLPQNGKIGLYRGETCPFDKFEVLYYSTTGQRAISYPLCPKCYSNPPFDEVSSKTMSCNQCLHETCKQSLVNNQVYLCMEVECKGDLVFDPLSGPNWRIGCNACTQVYKIESAVHKLARLSDRCPDCSAALFSVEFHKNSWDSLKMKSHLGCFFCDSVLKKLVSSVVGSRSKFRGRRGGRGRGRGRKLPKEFNGDPRMTFDGF